MIILIRAYKMRINYLTLEYEKKVDNFPLRLLIQKNDINKVENDTQTFVLNEESSTFIKNLIKESTKYRQYFDANALKIIITDREIKTHFITNTDPIIRELPLDFLEFLSNESEIAKKVASFILNSPDRLICTIEITKILKPDEDMRANYYKRIKKILPESKYDYDNIKIEKQEQEYKVTLPERI